MNPSGHERAPERPVYHVITPGDHFSPRTGSAIPTVVHGLAEGARQSDDTRRYPQHVVLQKGTFQPRYTSASAVEYSGIHAPDRRRRATDVISARIGLSRRGALAYFRPAVERLGIAQPGIVLAHNAPVVASLAKKQAHTVMLYAHNDVLRSYTKAESSRVLADAARIVCVSDALASELREHLPMSLHDRVRVVANGADTSRFSPRETTTPPAPFRVMFIGRMIPEKGADILLEAAAMLEREDLEIIIVGSHGFDAKAELTPFEQGLRSRSRDLRGTVRFEPFVDRFRLPSLLQEADVLIVPSRWSEPSTLTVGEGFASGLPVIAARVGGIPEVVGDAGMLFDPQHPEELASMIGELADHPARRAEWGKKALARARSHDWAWSWRQLAAVLDETGVPS